MTTDAIPDAPAQTDIRKVAMASAIGCTIEWYDFFLYNTFAALVFNKLFFPSFDPLVGTMLAYATALVRFIARPIAGISFVYQFSGIFASGLTPIIATALLTQNDGQPWLVATYMLIVGVISALSVCALRETAQADIVNPAEQFAASRPAG
jgi:hypothetical protein